MRAARPLPLVPASCDLEFRDVLSFCAAWCACLVAGFDARTVNAVSRLYRTVDACDSLSRGMYVRRQFAMDPPPEASQPVATAGDRVEAPVSRRCVAVWCGVVIDRRGLHSRVVVQTNGGDAQPLFALGVTVNPKYTPLLGSREGFYVLDQDAFPDGAPTVVPAVTALRSLPSRDALPSFQLYGGVHESADAELMVFDREVVGALNTGVCVWCLCVCVATCVRSCVASSSCDPVLCMHPLCARVVPFRCTFSFPAAPHRALVTAL